MRAYYIALSALVDTRHKFCISGCIGLSLMHVIIKC